MLLSVQVNEHKALPIVVWWQVVSSSEGDVMLFVFLTVSDCKRSRRNGRDARSWVRKEEKKDLLFGSLQVVPG